MNSLGRLAWFGQPASVFGERSEKAPSFRNLRLPVPRLPGRITKTSLVFLRRQGTGGSVAEVFIHEDDRTQSNYH
jgi:hypothetical protein